MKKSILIALGLVTMALAVVMSSANTSYAWLVSRVSAQPVSSMGSVSITIDYESDCGETGASRVLLFNTSTVPISVSLSACYAYRDAQGSDLVRDVSNISFGAPTFEGVYEQAEDGRVLLRPGQDLQITWPVLGIGELVEGGSFHVFWSATASVEG